MQTQAAAEQGFWNVSVRLKRSILPWICPGLGGGRKASLTSDFTWGQGATDGLARYDTRRCFISVSAAGSWWMLASTNISVGNLILTETVFHIEENFCSAKKKGELVWQISQRMGCSSFLFLYSLTIFSSGDSSTSSECFWSLFVHFHLYSSGLPAKSPSFIAFSCNWWYYTTPRVCF